MIKDFLFKMKLLFVITIDTFHQWKEEVWDVECLDDVYCCTPNYYNPCGCDGITVRHQLEWEYLRRNVK